MYLNVVEAFLMLVFCFAIGDIISARTKALVPSIFISALLFLTGYWTFWPQQIVDLAGMGNAFANGIGKEGNVGMAIGRLSTALIVTNMGTTISIKQLLNSWKTVVVALFALAGVTVGVIFIGGFFMSHQQTIVAAPVMAGGLVAALVMQDAALKIGMADVATLAILVFVIQGFVGYPLTAFFLRKEGSNLIEDYRKLSSEEKISLKNSLDGEEETKEKQGLLSRIPKKYISANVYLLQVAILAFIAVKLTALLNGIIPGTIMYLMLGILGRAIGFVEPAPVTKSGSMGLVILIQLIYALSFLNLATPQMVAGLIVPLIIASITGVVGLIILSLLVGPGMGYSKNYSIALGLNCLLGFPPNMIITNDVSASLAENEDEEEYLNSAMLPNMLIAGFTTVTIGSVLLAGFMIKFL